MVKYAVGTQSRYGMFPQDVIGKATLQGEGPTYLKLSGGGRDTQ